PSRHHHTHQTSHISAHSGRSYIHPNSLGSHPSAPLTFGRRKTNLQWLRWRCVLGASLIHFCLGSVHTLGNLLPYIIGYIRVKQDPHPTATYKVRQKETPSQRTLSIYLSIYLLIRAFSYLMYVPCFA
ncbi:major facilitator family protein, partial [Cystoisospora suis]